MTQNSVTCMNQFEFRRGMNMFDADLSFVIIKLISAFQKPETP